MLEEARQELIEARNLLSEHYREFVTKGAVQYKAISDDPALRMAVEKEEEQTSQNLQRCAEVLNQAIDSFQAQVRQKEGKLHAWVKTLSDFAVGLYPMIILPVRALEV